jgi:signal transduction histidine kinase
MQGPIRSLNLGQKWEDIFARERSFATRSIVASMAAIIGFAAIYYIYGRTGLYFPSLTIITIAFIAIYGGVFIGISLAFILSVAADYFFIPPIGAIFSSHTGYEHFVIIVSLAVLVACLGSSLRTAFRRTILAKQEAERASLLMEKVLALVAHDIRSPLSGLMMGSQFILKTPGQTDKHQSILAMMLRGVEQANSMIEALLDVASIRAGKTIYLDFQTCDLSGEVGRMIEELSLMERGRLDFTAETPIWGDWGISGIRRALVNLVTNAIKYGTPNTPIIINLQRINDHAVLSVHNQGHDIPVEDQEKLFDAFERSRGTENSALEGWGLGLASVKGIAEAHGGVVKVESAKNTGTTFTLELPIRRVGRKAPSLRADPRTC